MPDLPGGTEGLTGGENYRSPNGYSSRFDTSHVTRTMRFMRQRFTSGISQSKVYLISSNVLVGNSTVFPGQRAIDAGATRDWISTRQRQRRSRHCRSDSFVSMAYAKGIATVERTYIILNHIYYMYPHIHICLTIKEIFRVLRLATKYSGS